MKNLSLGDLDLGLSDLVTERKADLEASAVGKVYAPQIIAQQQAINALVRPQNKRVNTDELAEVDADHDGFGNAIFHYVDAILAAPGLAEVTKAAARRVREAFVPARSVLNESYADEAKQAKDNRAKLVEYAADLKTFPVPEGKTLYDWATAFVNAGESLSELLSDRASTEALAVGSGALRPNTIALLGRFRATLRDEVSWNQSLPRDLESRVFSYIDELSERRRKNKQAKESRNEQTEPPAEPDSAPGDNLES